MSTVLIVDDDEASRLVIGELVRAAGHDALFACDGEMATAFLRKNAVDVVVTDLAMPGLNGLRLIRNLRDMGETIPIIAISGRNADQLQLAEDYGANAAIPKPVNPGVLLELVRTLVDQNERMWSEVWA